jgi:hypothetical protein
MRDWWRLRRAAKKVLEQGQVLVVEHARVLPAIRRVLERYQALWNLSSPFLKC